MPLITYRLKERTTPTGKGITNARRGSVEAIVKEDTHEAPAQVYCEHVARSLAALIGVPAAVGVLVAHDHGLKYASLALAQYCMSLPDIATERQVERLLSRYPIECAGVFVFDLWIGNADRLGNVKAGLGKNADRIFCAIDHGGALLNCRGAKEDSMEALRSNADWPRSHPFAAGVDPVDCDAMVGRIRRIDAELIHGACVVGETAGSAFVEDQEGLAEALIERRNMLPAIVARVLKEAGR